MFINEIDMIVGKMKKCKPWNFRLQKRIKIFYSDTFRVAYWA